MDKSELEQAIKFLHECGVLLHFNDLQTKLCKLYFLDPEWLCTLMAHIITFKHISFVNEKGVSQGISFCFFESPYDIFLVFIPLILVKWIIVQFFFQ